MEAKELKDDELVAVTGGSAVAESMYLHKYHAMFKNLGDPYCYNMDDAEKVYKQVMNMYQEECMGNDLTPQERDGIYRTIQNMYRKCQREAAVPRKTSVFDRDAACVIVQW